MMTLAPQLIKRITSIINPRILNRFRKIRSWNHQETTRKRKFKATKIENVQTTTSHLDKIHDFDNELAEKITEILNVYEKNPNFEGKPSFKNGVTIVADSDIALLNVDTNNKIISIDHQKTENQTYLFTNTW